MKQKPRTESDHALVEPEQEVFPFGLQVRMANEQLDQLGITTLPPVGTKLTMNTNVEVVSVSETEEIGSEPRRHLELQITDLELLPPREDGTPDVTGVLYPGGPTV